MGAAEGSLDGALVGLFEGGDGFVGACEGAFEGAFVGEDVASRSTVQNPPSLVLKQRHCSFNVHVVPAKIVPVSSWHSLETQLQSESWAHPITFATRLAMSRTAANTFVVVAKPLMIATQH